VVGRSYVLGVDGGATRTVALLGTTTPTTTAAVLGRGESGSSNYHNVGIVAAGNAIRKAAVNAKKQGGVPKVKAEIAVVALAALDSTHGIQIARRFVRDAHVARRIFVIHDSVSALYAATKGSQGIIVNCGTGCFAAGMNDAGEYARVGGWGYLIDDKGSAFEIGMKAITMGFRMADGRTPRSDLTSILKTRMAVRRFDEILDRIYSNQIGVEEIAALAPYISKAAGRDKVCREILREVGTSLAELACTTAKRLKMAGRSFPLFMMGGGFKSGRYFIEPFTSGVRCECPRVRFLALEDEPVLGSYLIATKLARGEKTLSRNDRWLRKVVN
jgi:N-acetylglucosamine kinase